MSNKKIEPSKFNPFENLIDAYVNSEKINNLPIFNTELGIKGIDVNNRAGYQSQLDSWTNKLLIKDFSRYSEQQIRTEINKVQKILDIIDKSIGYDKSSGKFTSIERNSSYNGRRSRSREKTEYVQYGVDSESESDGFEYGSDPSGDFGTYMAYYRSLGIYIKNYWVIDTDFTDNAWRIKMHDSNWSMIVIRFIGTEQQRVLQQAIPLGFDEALSYYINERRWWVLANHLAFSETIDNRVSAKFNSVDAEYYDFRPLTKNEIARLGSSYNYKQNEGLGYWFDETIKSGKYWVKKGKEFWKKEAKKYPGGWF